MLIKKDMKKDLVIELKMCGEWFCRGDRGWEEWEMDVNVDKIRRVWEENKGEDEVDSDDLNRIESWILNGDYGFLWDDGEDSSNSKRGISGCMSRVDDLLEGKSVMIECEEEVFCIGSKSSEEVEIDFCKGKIELLKG